VLAKEHSIEEKSFTYPSKNDVSGEKIDVNSFEY